MDRFELGQIQSDTTLQEAESGGSPPRRWEGGDQQAFKGVSHKLLTSQALDEARQPLVVSSPALFRDPGTPPQQRSG